MTRREFEEKLRDLCYAWIEGFPDTGEEATIRIQDGIFQFDPEDPDQVENLISLLAWEIGRAICSIMHPSHHEIACLAACNTVVRLTEYFHNHADELDIKQLERMFNSDPEGGR